MKHPVFTTTIVLLGIVFLTGGILTGWQTKIYFDKEKSLEEVVRNRDNILKQKPAPTEANLVSAKENYKQIKERETEIFNVIRGSYQFKSERVEAADLVGKLRESSEKLNRDVIATKARIYKPETFGFGFRRYLAGNDGLVPRTRFEDLALEKEVVEWLVGRLLDAKNNEQDSLIIQTVAREPVELVVNRAASSHARLNDDECVIDTSETLRKKGIVDTFCFRLVFTARTDVLRNFIRRVENSGYPLFLRSIAVAPAKKGVLEQPKETVATPAVTIPPADAPATTPPPTATASTPAATPVIPALPTGFDSGPTVAAAPAAAPTTAPEPTSPVAPPVTVPQEDAIVRDTPSEFTVTFEYVVPIPVATDPATKTSNN
ncbi:MAG: Amuc_1100 family pilus-like protein [Puniceicoccales bacterium]|jgi:hypothetical protein|nr:Amuc_1100 family pilus-like protein [Puniceicoccales bacterium]